MFLVSTENLMFSWTSNDFSSHYSNYNYIAV